MKPVTQTAYSLSLWERVGERAYWREGREQYFLFSFAIAKSIFKDNKFFGGAGQ